MLAPNNFVRLIYPGCFSFNSQPYVRYRSRVVRYIRRRSIARYFIGLRQHRVPPRETFNIGDDFSRFTGLLYFSSAAVPSFATGFSEEETPEKCTHDDAVSPTSVTGTRVQTSRRRDSPLGSLFQENTRTHIPRDITSLALVSHFSLVRDIIPEPRGERRDAIVGCTTRLRCPSSWRVGKSAPCNCARRSKFLLEQYFAVAAQFAPRKYHKL